ncbi:zinc finger protein 271-like [Adelges cooleyi]|uniref:zinc finger protein 271-like n=1 Tax=Adelges cooleyi TaxID=133065 RepID=UPI00217F65C9|nr:zinc finger protein 271-like [Adelges cooleyi]
MEIENDELQFCRFCLRHSQSSFPIFMPSDPDLAKDIMNCLQIKLSSDSIGPKHICNECYDRVQDWVMFKKQSEEALKEIESNINFNEKESITTSHLELIDEVDYHCCLFCDKMFPSDYELLKHVSEMHQEIAELKLNAKKREERMDYSRSFIDEDEEDAQCDQYIESLTKSFMSKTDYDELNEVPTSDEGEDNKFQCYYCSATFEEFVLLKQHSVSRHRDLNKKTECNKCNKIFLTVADLQEHVTQFHPTRKNKQESESILRSSKKSPYICHICDKTFSRFCDLLDHDEIQHDDLPKRFRCGVCSKMFLMEDRAKVHFNFYHTKTKGTMNFQCSFCGMELKSASAVANHERMHMTQKTTNYGYKIIRD